VNQITLFGAKANASTMKITIGAMTKNANDIAALTPQ
jgi:hypothetical protein